MRVGGGEGNFTIPFGEPVFRFNKFLAININGSLLSAAEAPLDRGRSERGGGWYRVITNLRVQL